jgi:uncharacterized protein (TIGR02996 family)
MARRKRQSSSEPGREELLAAVREAPDDDAPRLVFSDWLEEHGQGESDQARAEFIRLQCRMARLEEYSPERLDLVGREQELLADHEPSWRQELNGRIRHMEGSFQRGFLSTVQTEGHRFLENAQRLVASTPLQGLRVWGHDKVLPVAFFKSAILGQLVDLDLRHSKGGGPTGLAFARCTHLGLLRRLVMPSGWGAPKSLLELVSSGRLSGLEELDPGYHRADLKLVRTVLMSPHLPRLRALHLCNNSLGDDDISDLAALPELARLRTLILCANQLGDRGVRALARSPCIGLRELDLAHNHLTDEGLRELARSKRLASLHRLRLDGVGIWSSGLQELARSPHLAGLTVLDLRGCGIGDEGVVALACSTHLRNLRHLCLGSNHLTIRVVEALASSPNLGQLTHLNLSANSLAGVGQVLARSSTLVNLHTLDLSRTDLGAADLTAMARSPNLAGLRDLKLSGNNIGPQGAAALAESPHLTGLRSLSIYGNGLGDKGITALAQGAALSRIVHLEAFSNRSSRASKELLRKRFGKRVML